jgi:O-antigen/teichoic acid export membrane protein
MTRGDHGDGGLRGLVKRGVGWTMASQGVMQVLALLTSVVVARFMAPRAVGLAGEAIVFATLVIVIVDFGFGAAIIQRPTLSQDELSTLFWAGIALGVLLTLAGVALSAPIADLYGQPRVRDLFAVLSATFLIVAPGIVQGALLIREMRFRSLELRTIAATAVSCSTAITLAVLGAGPWAIVAQTLVMAGVSTVLLWKSSSWRPRWTFSLRTLRGFLGFSTHVLGAQMLTWANANLDNLLVGRYVGAAPLGAYSLAYGVALTPVNRVAVPITNVFFPAFSRLRERERIADVWLRAVRILAVLIVPLMFGLIAVAPDLVSAVFGRRWQAAAPVMQILAGIALLQALTALRDGVLTALAQTRTLFRFVLVLSALTLAGFAAGLPWGITGVAWGYLIVSVVLQPVSVWLTARAVGVSVWAWVRAVAGAVEAGAMMLAIVLVARWLLVRAGVPAGVRLAALVVLGAVVYVPAVLWRVPDIVAEVRSVLARRAVVDAGADPRGDAGVEAPAAAS